MHCKKLMIVGIVAPALVPRPRRGNPVLEKVNAVRNRMSLRETDLIHTPQLRRRPTRCANTLSTVSLRTYSPAPRVRVSTEHYVVVNALVAGACNRRGESQEPAVRDEAASTADDAAKRQQQRDEDISRLDKRVAEIEREYTEADRSGRSFSRSLVRASWRGSLRSS